LRGKLLEKMIFLKSAVLRTALVIKDFLIIVNCLIGSWDRKLLLFEINEKRSVKTLSHVASKVTKHSEWNKNNFLEGERFL
jgi:hypothetical protein